ncbi:MULTISPECIES: MBL fold metallo-hydrolase [Halanaerobium]|uniref:Glyoxylase, beta-lactamase superfamily II n=1 Tax=Halanaerobium kushneri TaxID=56779 RepID=A0A1N6V8L2_9FIRM|nr:MULTISPECIES: MBL fold metallo-hydrolase [Halanaerobium]RCW52913.1 glyoxylase-like metal-dependent hydrolase (beta-lactamase superfamily II) [Halanaerobium sp. ST460_2HS_T2]SIQ74172.1 Glyoxylase, beta-lactamase superfamily II [Halanaerobium kushneri]
MDLKEFTVGELMVKSYIVSQAGQAVIIDPGAEGERLFDYLKNNNLELKYIINTHGHFDHIAANEFLKEKTGAEVLAHPKANLKFTDPKLNLSALFLSHKVTAPAIDRSIDDGESLKFESLTLKIISTPGHSEDGISIYIPEENILFSGDCIFANGIGRTDLEDSDFKELKNSVEKKLFQLPASCIFYPGHGPSGNLGSFKNSVWPAIS